MKEKTIEIEPLITMFVIAMGTQICGGCGFTYFIKLPTCFKQVKFKGSIVELCAMQVNSECNLEFWFIDCFTDETFSLSLDYIKKNYPLMFASVVTHVCDTIENVDEI